jgi:hypothetical protein
VTIAAVVAVAVAVGVFAVLANVGSDSKHKATAAPRSTTTFPAVWDPRINDLVRFDSAERNLDYKHPVKVVFLSKAAFKKRVTADESKLTAKDRRELQTALEFLRALGMVDGKVDLFTKLNQLRSESVLAFYDSKKKEIVIPGSELDVEQRVTLAHELTHTLDDQHFDLTKLDKLGDKYDTDAITALVEGDAVRVENRFIAKLSAADRRAYARANGSDGSGGSDSSAAPNLEGVPKIFGILQQWPYDIGPQFVDILNEEGGQSRINQAFRSPPRNEEQVIDPLTYLNDDQAGPIKPPVLPSGAKKLDGGKEFGLLGWYLVLSERIDPHVAMRAALGWGSDSYTVAREGTRTCVEVHYRGENRSDNAEMMNALGQWIAALPKGMAAVKANSDDTLSLRSCDPGSAGKVVTDRSVDAYGLLVFRGQLIDEFVKAGGTPAVSTCVANAVTDRVTIADLSRDQLPPILTDQAALSQIGQTCRATAGTVVAHDHIDG